MKSRAHEQVRAAAPAPPDGEMAKPADDPRRDFPRRTREVCWPASLQDAAEILARIDVPPFRPVNDSSFRHHGTARLLEWLSSFPGASWQERWLASGAGALPKQQWLQLPMAWRAATGRTTAPSCPDTFKTGLLMLICADVIRPALQWMVPRSSPRIMAVMALCRDPDGYAALRALIDADPGITTGHARLALGRITMILACQGGSVADITVGDYLDLLDAMHATNTGGAGRLLAYQLLHTLGTFAPGAPATGRAFLQAAGQRSVEELVDRYQLACRPVRDLLVDYLRERQPALDYNTLNGLAGDLARLFWADLEHHHPGIDSLQLAPETVTAWRHRLGWRSVTAEDAAGNRTSSQVPRANARKVMTLVRAFYLDIAQWALDEPERWAPWAVPCPIKEADCLRAKDDQLVKARMDQRTRIRLPLLPALADALAAHRRDSRELLSQATATAPGASFTTADAHLSRLHTPTAYTGSIWVLDAATGQRINLTRQDRDAFWAWAFVEVLRHTGIRFEELRELSHHSIAQYRLPSTGELVPLLQIAPSKTNTERVLLVTPELADVLSTVISRIRTPEGAVALVPSYDVHERTWNPPMPLLFQHTFAGERRSLSDGVLRQIFQRVLARTGILGPDGQPLVFTPHDFRRIFVTDAVLQGLPPHIAQLICGHADISTTMRYKAIYPAEAIEAHRAFIARRRATRPSQEYRTPTEEEWDEFLGHFERRKLSTGTCGRAFGTPCIHEHACIRCPMLRPDPRQYTRLQEIHDNLLARIAEAQHEGWLGEIDGLQVSLAGAREKLAQLTASHHADLGLPSFPDIAGRNSPPT